MKNPLNIIQIFASAGWGGGEKYACDLSRELIRNGHKVIIVSRPSNIISAKATEYTIPHRTLPLNGILDFISAVRLARMIRQQDTDIIHVHNFKDAFTAVYANLLTGGRARVILTRHLVRKGKNSLPYRWLYKHLDRMIFVSQLARDEFLSTASQEEAKAEVIYNSIVIPEQNAQDNLLPENLREKFGIGEDTFLIGFTGRMTPEKGTDRLIQAVGSIQWPDVAAILIGGGDDDYLNQLKNMAQKCGAGERVFFYGYADNVYGLIAQMDAGAAPSIAREAFCLSVIEYMSAGKPVITTDNGAQREYIIDGVNGLLVQPSNTAALAAAIETLAKDSTLCERIAAAGQRTFHEKFEYSLFYNRIMQVYSEAPPVKG